MNVEMYVVVNDDRRDEELILQDKEIDSKKILEEVCRNCSLPSHKKAVEYAERLYQEIYNDDFVIPE